MEEGDTQGAAQLYRETLKLDPNNSKTHYNLALALNRLGDRTGERDALEAAVRLDPKFALAHNQFGLLLLSEGKLPEAEKELQTALTIDPQFAEAAGVPPALEFGRFSQERRWLNPDRSSFLGNRQGKQAFRVL